MTGVTARTPLRPSWSTARIYRFTLDRPFAQKRSAGRSSPPGAILAAAPHGGRRPRRRDLDMRRDRADLRVERTHRAWRRPGRPELRCDMDGARLTARNHRAHVRTRIGDTGLAAGDRLVEARPDNGDTRLTAGDHRAELQTRIGDTGLAARNRLVEARPDSGGTRLTAGAARPELRAARRGRHPVAVQTTRRQGRIGAGGKPLRRHEWPGARIEVSRP